MFSLHFSNDNKPNTSTNATIVINDFSENVSIPLDYWKEPEYLLHWKNSVTRILDENYRSTVFLVSMHEPETINFVNIWTMQKSTDAIIVQNELLFAEKMAANFTVDNVYAYIEKRDELLDDEEVSRWFTTTESVEAYRQELQKALGLL